MEILEGIGGQVTRRNVLAGAAVGVLAGVLADPVQAQEVAASLDMIELTTKTGRKVSGALALPEALPAPTMLIMHEWWGLNDAIKTMAAAFAEAGYVTLAVDLYDGVVATTPADAGYTMRNVKSEEAVDTVTSWVDWLRGHEHSDGKLGTCGWCFGGGWSLNTSLAAPVDATVIYYGNVVKTAGELAKLDGPVLGHFGTRDTYINDEMVGAFADEMAKAEKSLEIHWYKADHAFANPTSARYDGEDAALAWTRTLAFLEANLKPVVAVEADEVVPDVPAEL